jgi:hypothetical protein
MGISCGKIGKLFAGGKPRANYEVFRYDFHHAELGSKNVRENRVIPHIHTPNNNNNLLFKEVLLIRESVD